MKHVQAQRCPFEGGDAHAPSHVYAARQCDVSTSMGKPWEGLPQAPLAGNTRVSATIGHLLPRTVKKN